MILIDIIEYMERNNNIQLTFDLDKLKPQGSFDEKKISNDFLINYIPDLDDKIILEKMKSTNDKNIKDYLGRQYNKIKDNNNIFSNDTIVLKLYTDKEGQKLFHVFSENFYIVKNVIKKIFKKIIENIHLIPLSIKYISKMMLIISKKKFPNIETIDLNIFLGTFFFNKIFFPIFSSPDLLGLINSFFISNVTLENINIISIVFKQLIKFELFTNTGYTIFNWFFIKDIIPVLFDFFEKLTEIDFPQYVNKLVNGEIDENDFIYDYFNEYPKKNIYHQSIFFCIKDCFNIISLINIKPITFPLDIKNIECKNEKKKKEIIAKRNKLNLLYEKLMSQPYFNNLNDLYNSKQKDYFLITQTLFSESLEKIKKIKQNPCFIKEELKGDDDNINETNKIIKIQNFLSNLLYYCRTFNTIKFSEEIKTNTISILRELVKFIGTGSFVSSSSIPSEWYAQTLIQLLSSLPEEYKENDFYKIYSQLTDNLNLSIKSLNSEFISQIYSDLDFTERTKSNLKYVKKCLLENDLNIIAKEIIDNSNYIILLEYDKNMTFIKIHKKEQVKTPKKIKKNDEKEGIKKIECRSIKEFIDNFPNFSEYQQKTDIDLFNLYNENKLCENFTDLFEDIKTQMITLKINQIFNVLETYNKYINSQEEENKKQKKKIIKEEIDYDELIVKIDEIIEKYSDFLSVEVSNDRGKVLEEITNKFSDKLFYKIFGYIMYKLYDKIFPDSPDEEDINIYQKCVKLSWIQPKDLLKENKYMFYDNFITDTSKLIKKFTSDKSLINKINCLQKIFQIINQCINFNSSNSKNETGVDDLLPIFQYVLIKAQPEKLNSNITYLENFMYRDLANGAAGQNLVLLRVITEALKNFNNSFNGTPGNI